MLPLAQSGWKEMGECDLNLLQEGISKGKASFQFILVELRVRSIYQMPIWSQDSN